MGTSKYRKVLKTGSKTRVEIFSNIEARLTNENTVCLLRSGKFKANVNDMTGQLKCFITDFREENDSVDCAIIGNMQLSSKVVCPVPPLYEKQNIRILRFGDYLTKSGFGLKLDKDGMHYKGHEIISYNNDTGNYERVMVEPNKHLPATVDKTNGKELLLSVIDYQQYEWEKFIYEILNNPSFKLDITFIILQRMDELYELVDDIVSLIPERKRDQYNLKKEFKDSLNEVCNLLDC